MSYLLHMQSFESTAPHESDDFLSTDLGMIQLGMNTRHRRTVAVPKRHWLKVDFSHRTARSMKGFQRTAHQDRKAVKPEPKELERMLDEGDVFLSLSLVRIWFPKGMSDPFDASFADHVMSRSRVADRIICVGYADSRCSYHEAERLACERSLAALNVIMRKRPKAKLIAIAAPKRAYSTGPQKYSRRAEIHALYNRPRKEDPTQ